MRHQLPTPIRGLHALLWTTVLLFAARVAAQALQLLAPVPFLPPFSAFQGSALPYHVLLPAQLALLIAMIYFGFGVQAGQVRRRPSLGRALMVFAAVYFAVMFARLLIGLAQLSDHVWFHAWIPVMFHFVLAGYCVILARYHLGSARLSTPLPQAQ